MIDHQLYNAQQMQRDVESARVTGIMEGAEKFV